MTEKITLIVKAANQSVDDHRVECSPDWTVRRLKECLSNVFPSKPPVEQQRLIYSGQLLLDSLELRVVLRHPPENNAYTLHLVCSSASSGSHPSRQNPVVYTSHPHTATTMSTNHEGTHTDSADGLRRRIIGSAGDSSIETQQQSLDTPGVYPSFSQAQTSLLQVADPVQQMAAMQQMYANYLASYMHYMQMGGGGSFVLPQQMMQVPSPRPTSPPASSASSESDSTAQSQQQPQADLAEAQEPQPAQPQQPQRQQQPPPQIIRMNAQGGEVADDDDNDGLGRDWLDYVYVASRMLVLLSIVYFYSTLSRFMLVTCIAMLLYLFQAGWFRPIRRVEEQQPVIQPQNDVMGEVQDDDRNNNVENNNNNNNNNEAPPEADHQSEEEEDDQDIIQEEVPVIEEEAASVGNQQPSLLTLSWMFLTSFFTSLIPEQPQMI